MKRSCKFCIWYGKCNTKNVCEYFDPVDETEDYGEDADQKKTRREFREEWLEYFQQDNDVDFCEEPISLYAFKAIKTQDSR